MEKLRTILATYGRNAWRGLVYFVACLAIGLLGFGAILLAWTAASPFMGLVVGGGYIAFLIFGPLKSWLKSLVETGTLDLHRTQTA